MIDSESDSRKMGDKMGEITVTEEAVMLLRRLERYLQQTYHEILTDAEALQDVYVDNKYGLGIHSDSIEQLIYQLQAIAKSNTSLKRLARKLRFSANNRQKHLDSDFPMDSNQPNQDSSLQTYVAGVLGRIYASGYRELRTPSANGIWRGNLFIPDSDYKPTKYNPNSRTFREIIQSLEENYGIRYNGTPFMEGYADFSEIALAQIGLEDIATKHNENFLTNADQLDFGEVFSSRNQNFCYADQIAAEKGLHIGDLPPGYTASDLAQWRKKHHFTWDESYINGYLLVPSEIHNNIPHTGLVGISGHGTQAEENITQRLLSLSDMQDDF